MPNNRLPKKQDPLSELIEYSDGQDLEKKDIPLISFLKKHNLLQGERVPRACFTGVISINEKTYIFLPKGFKPTRNKAENARTLFRAIKKYTLSGKGQKFNISNGTSGIQGIPPLEALEILQDYIKFGLYKHSRIETARLQTGRISWNRVIKTSLPLIRKDNKPVYPNLITRKTNYFAENKVTEIHKAIVIKLDNIFGWYFSDYSIAPKLNCTKLHLNKNQAIRTIQKELNNTYSDREIKLLQNIIAVLSKDTLDSSNAEYYSGVTNFQHIWETICSSIYSNDKDKLSPLIPIPAYIWQNGLKTEPSNKQIMDIILKNDTKIAILDAKYYDFSRTKPQWSDLVKQFYYNHSLSAVLPEANIENFFIAPKIIASDTPQKAIIVKKDGKRLDQNFPPINIIYLNVKEAMEAYTSSSAPLTYRQDLFDTYYNSTTMPS